MKLCKLNARLTYHSGIGSYQPFMVGLYLAKNHIADDWQVGKGSIISLVADGEVLIGIGTDKQSLGDNFGGVSDDFWGSTTAFLVPEGDENTK